MSATVALTGGAKWTLIVCQWLWLAAAAVQLNDPDPVAWVAVYVAASAVLYVVGRNPKYHGAAAIFALGTLGWAVQIGPHWIVQVPVEQLLGKVAMATLGVELARESAGLLLVTASLIFAFVVGRRSCTQVQGARTNSLP